MNKFPSKKNLNNKLPIAAQEKVEKTIQVARQKPYVTLLLAAAIPLVILLAFTFKSGFVPHLNPHKKLDKIVVVKTPTEVADEATAALQKKDTDLFLDILDKYAKKDVNLVNSKGDPLIVVAATIGNYTAVEALIAAGADVNKTNAFTKDTALHRSIYYDFPEITRRLIHSGANINAVNNYNHSPLFLAVEKQKPALIDSLLLAGATEGVSKNYLFRSCAQKKPLGVLAMLKGGIKPDVTNEKGNTPLIISSSLGDVASVNHLLTYRADINHANNDGNTALIYAARYNHPDVIRELLRQRNMQIPADVNIQNKKGETALYWAAAQGYTEVVKRLLAADADPTIPAKDGLIPYRVAQKNGRGQVLEWFDKPLVEVKNSVIAADNAAILAKAKAEGKETDLDDDGESAKEAEPLKEDDIFKAAEDGDLEKINSVLDEFGTVITSRVDPKRGITAFLLAVKNDHPEAAQLLLDYGARIFATSPLGNAFHIAAQSGNVEILKMLVDQARRSGHFVMMLEYSTTINRFDGTPIENISTLPDGKNTIKVKASFTPLGLAAYFCNKEVYDYLVSLGAKAGSSTDKFSPVSRWAQCKTKVAGAKNLQPQKRTSASSQKTSAQKKKTAKNSARKK